jgi:hypothetical protein
VNVAWRYALAVVSVAHALAVGLLLASYNFATIEFPVFFFALAVTARYGLVRRYGTRHTRAASGNIRLHLFLHGTSLQFLRHVG